MDLCSDEIYQKKIQVDSIFDRRIMKDQKSRFSAFVGLIIIIIIIIVISIRPILVHVPQTTPQEIQVRLMARSICMSQERVLGHV